MAGTKGKLQGKENRTIWGWGLSDDKRAALSPGICRQICTTSPWRQCWKDTDTSEARGAYLSCFLLSHWTSARVSPPMTSLLEVLWPWHHDRWPHSAPQDSGPSRHTPSASRGTSSSASSSCQVFPLPLSLALKQFPAVSHPQAQPMLRVSVKALFLSSPLVTLSWVNHLIFINFTHLDLLLLREIVTCSSGGSIHPRMVQLPLF